MGVDRAERPSKAHLVSAPVPSHRLGPSGESPTEGNRTAFLTFMVYFRRGGLYPPCPLVQRDKGPVFTIFFWVGISSNGNNCEVPVNMPGAGNIVLIYNL